MTLQKAILSRGMSNRTVPNRGYRALSSIITRTISEGMELGDTVGYRIIRAVPETLVITATPRAGLGGVLRDTIVINTRISKVSYQTVRDTLVIGDTVRSVFSQVISGTLTISARLKLSISFVQIHKISHRTFNMADRVIHRFGTITRTESKRTDNG